MSIEKHLVIVLFLVTLFPLTAVAEMQEYIREYTHRVGDADSKVTSRQISMQEIKVELLSELGTYVNSRVEISQGNKTETEFKEEIIALTAGFVQVDMIEERFNGETYFLKAKLSADPDDVVARINELGNTSKQSQEDKEKLLQAYQDNKAIRAQLAALQEELRIAKAAGKETQNLENQYIKESEQLSTAALNELGNDYFIGRKGKNKDYVQAEHWYRKAAEQGHPLAQYNMGVMYYNGYGVAKDYTQAVSWYQKAAKQQHSLAQNNLAIMTLRGLGTTKSSSEAISWFRKSIALDNAKAQYNFGLMYLNGEGIKQSFGEALNWFLKAAAQDHDSAMNNLGLMYFRGMGVKKDPEQALSWFRKAAELGNAQGQFSLGLMYGKGHAVKKDPEEAILWISKAAEQGHTKAKQVLKKYNKHR